MKQNKKTQYDLFGQPIAPDNSLRRKFGEIPFSIINGGRPEWIKRRRDWVNLGIEAETGRDVKTFGKFNPKKFGNIQLSQTSIFNPVLTELMYDWFCVDGGKILDVFAGGAVRGLVANIKGYDYTGIELRDEQVEANFNNAEKVFGNLEGEYKMPNWILGDSREILLRKDLLGEHNSYDMMFTCPLYADLEVYSKLDADTSNKDYPEFLKLYRDILHRSIPYVKIGGYLVIVIGDVRDKQGNYRGLVADTIKIMHEGGAPLYNDIIFKRALGTAMIRVEKQFVKSRKLVKIHENVLVFKRIK